MPDKQTASKEDILESGNIYFIYRPRQGEEKVKDVEEVQRLHMVLEPFGEKKFRQIIIGRKKMPPEEQRGEVYWGFVDEVTSIPEEIEDEYDPRKAGILVEKGENLATAARPAGEGIYAIVRHENHVHLAYKRELPEKTGPVQADLNIEKEGSYIISVKNPQRPSPPGVGLPLEQRPEFPQELESKFKNRKFMPVDPVDFLDISGAEILFILANGNVFEELGVKLDPQKEDEKTAEIFNNLKMERDIHPKEALFKGEWV